MYKKLNPTFYTNVRNGESPIRVGINNHFFDNQIDRVYGVSLEHILYLIENHSITYNPDYDELPKGLSSECYKTITGDKQIKHNSEHCFKLLPSEDLVCILRYRKFIEINGKQKPYDWNEWVLNNVYRCNGGSVMYVPPTQPKTPIRVGGKIIGYVEDYK